MNIKFDTHMAWVQTGQRQRAGKTRNIWACSGEYRLLLEAERPPGKDEVRDCVITSHNDLKNRTKQVPLARPELIGGGKHTLIIVSNRCEDGPPVKTISEMIADGEIPGIKAHAKGQGANRRYQDVGEFSVKAERAILQSLQAVVERNKDDRKGSAKSRNSLIAELLRLGLMVKLGIATGEITDPKVVRMFSGFEIEPEDIKIEE